MESIKDKLLKHLAELKAQKLAAMRRAGEKYAVEIETIEKMLEIYIAQGDEKEGTTGVRGYEPSEDLFAETPLGLTPKEITKKLGKTTQEMVLEVLTPEPQGMYALDILAEINRRWLPTLQRTSLSPQLSRLKEAGNLLYVDGRWKLPSNTKRRPRMIG
jgi:hypothetical protein